MTLDCRKCGACCQPMFDPGYGKGGHTGYVALTDADAERLPKNLQVRMPRANKRLPVLDVFFMKTKGRGKDRRCTALEGEVGVKVRCGIYKDRPEACRQFQPGSPPCLEARAEAGVVGDNDNFLSLLHQIASPVRR